MRIMWVALVIFVLMFYVTTVVFYTVALIVIKKRKKKIIGVALGLLAIILAITGLSLANYI